MKKLLTLLLSFIMLVTYMPTMAFSAVRVTGDADNYGGTLDLNSAIDDANGQYTIDSTPVELAVDSSSSSTVDSGTVKLSPGEYLNINLTNKSYSSKTFNKPTFSKSGVVDYIGSESSFVISSRGKATIKFKAVATGTTKITLKSTGTSGVQYANITVIVSNTPLLKQALTIPKTEDNGLDGDVKVSLEAGQSTSSVDKYLASIYMPGSADLSKCFINWSNNILRIKIGDTYYASGELSVAQAKSAKNVQAYFDDDYCDLEFENVLQGSTKVRALFFNVDESMGTIDAMNKDSNHETRCYGDLTLGGKNYFMAMKGRGNTTWKDFAKKPYNITLYKEAISDPENLPKKNKVTDKIVSGVTSSKYSILANAKDPSCLRNKIGEDIAQRLGIGLQLDFVDVYMNGEYLGNYTICPKNDYQCPDEGFMVEIDNLNDTDQKTINGIKFTYKDGSDELTADHQPVWDYITQAVNALKNTTSDAYKDYIDVDSWAKMYLLNELYKDCDASAGSIFFTKQSMNSEDKLVAGPIWDLDGTMGRISNTWLSINHDSERSGGSWYIDKDRNSFFTLLAKHDDFMKRVYQLYNEYADDFAEMPQWVDDISQDIIDSANMNYIRWPDDLYHGKEHFNVEISRKADKVSGDVYRYYNTKLTTDPYGVDYHKTDAPEDFSYNLKEYLTKRVSFLDDQLAVSDPETTIDGETELNVFDRLDLSAGITGDTGSVDTYQWQQLVEGQWVDIEGENEDDYVVDSVKVDLDEAQFRCKLEYLSDNLIDTDTSHVYSGKVIYTDPVSLSVDLGDHTHEFTEEVMDDAFIASPRTCTQAATYYVSCLCGTSSEGLEEEATFVGPDPDGHKISKVDAVPSSTEGAGNIEYFKCDVCGDMFLDEAGEIFVKAEDYDSVIKVGKIKSIALEKSSYVYAGQEIKPLAVITNSAKKTLVQGIDYDITYDNNIQLTTEDSKATATITFKGNYTGSTVLEFDIVKQNLEDIEDKISLEYETCIYSGSMNKPKVTIEGLTENVDFTVDYDSSKKAGIADVIIIGINGVAGTVVKHFEILPLSLSNGTGVLSLEEGPFVFTGSEIHPSVTVKVGNTVLEEGEDKDYIVEYFNDVNVGGLDGMPTVKITGVNNYEDSLSQEYTISPKALEELDVDIEEGPFLHDGTSHIPSLSIKYGDIDLVEDTDFSIECLNNTNVGTASYTIVAKGNYTGTMDGEFQIVHDYGDYIYTPASFEKAGSIDRYCEYCKEAETTVIPKLVAPSNPEDGTYNGDDLMPSISIADTEGNILTEDEDYEIQWKNSDGNTLDELIDAGNYTGTITLKGDKYEGTTELTFTIKPADLPDISSLSQDSFEYTGEPILPDVFIDGLEYETDYVIKECVNNINVPSDSENLPTITVEGIGNYSGTSSMNFDILPKELTESDFSLEEDEFDYCGQAIDPTVITDLTEDTDYTCLVSNNLNAGKATVKFTGINNYTGEVELEFTINSIDLPEITSVVGAPLTYTAYEITPDVEIASQFGDKNNLVLNRDYTLSYEDNVDAGKAKVIAKGIGNYKSEVEAEFVINPAQIPDIVAFDPEECEFNGEAQTPMPIILGLYEDEILELDEDFTVDYGEDNVNIGKVTVTVTGKGNYTGTATGDFYIVKTRLPEDKISLSQDSFVYDGLEKKPDVLIEGLTKGVDYDIVEYLNNIDVPTDDDKLPGVKIEGLGNYQGYETINFTIEPASLSEKSYTLPDKDSFDYVYDKNAKTPKPVIDGLVEDEDFEVSYGNNIKAGTAQFRISGIGNYTGTIDGTFTIEKANLPEITSISGADNIVYDGSEKKPKITITGLYEGSNKDFVVEYKDNVNAGTATVTATATASGNYQGSSTKTFEIQQKQLPSITWIEYQECTYDGSAKTPAIKIGSLTNSDYMVSYSKDHTNAGTVTVVAQAVLGGNYTGTVNKTFKINPANLPSIKEVSPASFYDDKDPKEPDVVIDSVVKGETLVNKTDYELSYEKNDAVGEATVIATAKGNYTGVQKATFDIVHEYGDPITTKASFEQDGEIYRICKNCSDKTVDEVIPKAEIAWTKYVTTFNGKEQAPQIDTSKTNLPVQDFTISYSKDKDEKWDGKFINEGTYTIEAKLDKDKYSGTKTFQYVIEKASIENMTPVLSPASFTFNGESQKPNVSLSGLVLNQDFTVEFDEDTTNAGEHSITITGIGNYKGTINSKYTIEKQSIEKMTALLDEDEFTFDGKAKTPTVSISGLVKDEDFTVTYSNNTNAGSKALVSIAGKGNYTGTLEKNFTILPSELPEIELSDTEYVYDGKAHKPSVTNKELTLNKDYTLSYNNNVNVGTEELKPSVTVQGIGNYTGSKTVNFVINKAKLAENIFSITPSEFTYDKTEHTPAVVVKDTAGNIVSADNYDVSYENNKNVGTASVTVTAKANCEGVSTGTFKIVEKSINDLSVDMEEGPFVYNGQKQRPVFTIMDGDTELNTSDYEVEYSNNVNASIASDTSDLNVTPSRNGTTSNKKIATGDSFKLNITSTASSTLTYTISSDPKGIVGNDQSVSISRNRSATVTINGLKAGTTTITVSGKSSYNTYKATINLTVVDKPSAKITFKGNYKGEITKYFDIAKANVANCDITLEKESYDYTGSQIKPSYTVNGLLDSDYTVSYGSNKNAGTNAGSVTFTAQGNNCTGSKTIDFDINQIDLSDYQVELTGSTVYTGSAITPQVKVIGPDKQALDTSEYTLKWTNNVNVAYDKDNNVIEGASLEITGTKDYKGSITKTFKITPKQLSGTVNLSKTSYTYSGVENKPSVTIGSLVSNKDFVVAYANNVDAGQASVIVTGIGNYQGELSKTFTINPANLPAIALVNPSSYTDDKSKHEPAVVINSLVQGETLVEGVDYTLAYSNNTEYGTATVVASGMGNYNSNSSQTATFKIEHDYDDPITVKASFTKDGKISKFCKNCNHEELLETIPTATLALKATSVTFNEAEQAPEIDASKTNIEGYTITWKCNDQAVSSFKNAGTYVGTVNINDDKYSGETTLTYTISPKSIVSMAYQLSATSVVYSGEKQVPSVSFTDTRVTFNVTEPADPVNVSTRAKTLTVTGIGNYTGTIRPTYTITAHDLPKIESLSKTSYKDDDNEHKPGVVINSLVAGNTLVEGTDYTLTYENNKSYGTATVTATGIGNYKSTQSAQFSIEHDYAAPVTEKASFTKAGQITESCKNCGAVNEATKIDIPKAEIALKLSEIVYDGKEHAPEIDETKTNIDTSQYDIQWTYGGKPVSSFKEQGEYTGTVTLKGDKYAGTTNLTYLIGMKSIEDMTAQLSEDEFVYDGTAKEPSVSLSDSDATFTVSYDADHTNAGTKHITITGTGNYTGKLYEEYTIKPAELNDDNISLSYDKITFNAKECKPTVSIKNEFASGNLVENTDYKLDFGDDSVNAGEKAITITGIGNYSGSVKTAKYTIEKADLANITALSQDEYTYSGKECRPTVTIPSVVKGQNVSDDDYTLTYVNNINAGTATVKATAKAESNYEGTVEETFTINKKSIEKMEAKLPSSDDFNYVFDGKAKTPTVSLGELKENTDFKVTYGKNNVNASQGSDTVSVTVEGIGNYTGRIISTFTIEKADLPAIDSLSIDKFVYNGKEWKPEVDIKSVVEGEDSVAKTDYVLTYSNNLNAGTATVKASAVGNCNYTGYVEKTFVINKAELPQITLNASKYTFDGKEHKPSVTIKSDYEESKQVSSNDYTLVYSDDLINSGEKQVTATAKESSNYTGTQVAKFVINKAQLPRIDSLSEDTFVYNGKAHKPSVTIKSVVKGKLLVEGSDYALTYENNVKVGTGTVTATALQESNYTGSRNATFEITKLQLPEIVSLSQDKFVYNGEAFEPLVTILDEDGNAVDSDEYTLSYANNVNAGTATVTASANGSGSDYSGSVSYDFTIEQADLPEIESLSEIEFTYNGKEHKPTVVINSVVEGEVLQEDVDYKLTYEDNVDAGHAFVHATGIGNYKGASHDRFTINQATLEGEVVIEKDFDFEFDGKPKKPTVSIEGLTEGEDFEVSYDNRIEVGESTITLTGINNYQGEIQTSFNIVKGKLYSVNTTEHFYKQQSKGEEIVPEVVVKDKNGNVLVESKDYALSFENNKEAGTAVVKAIGTGSYEGTITTSFIIQDVNTQGIAIDGDDVKLEDGSLSCELSKEQVDELLNNLPKSTKTLSVVIANDEGEKVDDAHVKLTSDLVKQAANKGLDLEIKTRAGSIQISNAALKNINSKTSKPVTFNIKAGKPSGTSGPALSYKSDISYVDSKSKTVKLTNFGGASIKLELPVPEGLKPSDTIMIYKNGNYHYKKSTVASYDCVTFSITKMYETLLLNKTDAKKKIEASTKLSTVSSLKVQALKNGKIKLSWKKGLGNKPTYYYVYRSTKKSGKYTLLGKFKAGTSSSWVKYNAKNLKKGKTYYFKVRGYLTLSSLGVKAYTKYSTVKSVKCKKTRK
ncbi:MAG: CotH kinase family protein [Clostridia bacterium]|nr:CotH kinase family protein [Clostridia bacterium]